MVGRTIDSSHRTNLLNRDIATEERLRDFCDFLEEVGKDAKPKLIEVAKKIRKMSRGD